MKNLSETDILDIVKEGAEVLDGQGSFVVPFKYEREKAKPKADNRILSLFTQLLAALKETNVERKATRAILEKIAAGVQKVPAKEPAAKDSGYVFTVRRDSRGFITEIEANRKP